MWTKIRHAVDQALWRRGLREPTVRGVVRRGVLLTAGALAAGAPLAFKTPLLFWFGVGSLLAVGNFYALARRIGRLLPAGWSSSSLAALLLHTNARLLLTGFLLYICIIWCGASPFALLAGLTVVVIDVTLAGLWNSTPGSRSRPSGASPSERNETGGDGPGA